MITAAKIAAKAAPTCAPIPATEEARPICFLKTFGNQGHTRPVFSSRSYTCDKAKEINQVDV